MMASMDSDTLHPTCFFSYFPISLFQVQDALKEEMASIHALSIKKTWTPAQQAAATS